MKLNEDTRKKKQTSWQVFISCCGCVSVHDRIWMKTQYIGLNYLLFKRHRQIHKTYIGCPTPDYLGCVSSAPIYIWGERACRAASDSLGFCFTWEQMSAATDQWGTKQSRWRLIFNRGHREICHALLMGETARRERLSFCRRAQSWSWWVFAQDCRVFQSL